MIGLKTAKGTKQLKLDPSIYENIQKQKVEVGDVIYIEANSGAVKVSLIVLSILKWIGSFSLDKSSSKDWKKQDFLYIKLRYS